MEPISCFIRDKVDVRVYNTNENMGAAAADAVESTILKLLKEKDEISIIFSVAPSQFTLFSNLKKKEIIDWTRINLLYVDEDVGISADHPESCANGLNKWFADDLPFKGKYFIDGLAENLEEECARYANLLRKFKPEIALMGFGDNGHIALNEPGCGFFDDPQTVKVVRIDMKTKLQSFNNGTRKSLEGPDYGITMTLPALMKPKYKFCIVPFKTKAQAAYKAIFGDISEDCPASFIRNHENVVVFFDSESAALFPEVKN